ncbi:MAG: sugar phosphate isomerase/epimerase [Fimbriimonadaceae bacterium]|nr:sugar phosphate isomerase/epimerase [Fimbriimonadaceae bacterium]
MQLGFVSAILPDLDLDGVLASAARHGYDCVEAMCWPRGKAERRYAGVTHVDVGDLSPARVDAIGELCARHRVALSALGYYPNLLSPDAAEADACQAHLRRVIAGAAALGLGVVNTFIGRDPALSVDANWPRMRQVWRPLLAYAADCGVRIGIENCPMLFTADEWPGGKNLATSPVIWRRLFDDLDSPQLGLNYDPSHLVWQMMDPIAPIAEFAGRFWHTHAKDVRLNRRALDEVGILATPLAYHQPKLPGLGEVDWGAFFAALTDAGYAGAVCVEVEDRAYEGSLAARQAALQQSHAYLRPYCAAR